MLRMDMKVAAWLTDPSIPWSSGIKRRAGIKGAEAALRYLRDHAPVRTGRMKASWKLAGNTQGVSRRNGKYTIRLKNDAYEIRPRVGKHYYAMYPEYGFYHVWQRKYHPGRNDRIGAGIAAKSAIIDYMQEELPKEIERMKREGGGRR